MRTNTARWKPTIMEYVISAKFDWSATCYITVPIAYYTASYAKRELYSIYNIIYIVNQQDLREDSSANCFSHWEICRLVTVFQLS